MHLGVTASTTPSLPVPSCSSSLRVFRSRLKVSCHFPLQPKRCVTLGGFSCTNRQRCWLYICRYGRFCGLIQTDFEKFPRAPLPLFKKAERNSTMMTWPWLHMCLGTNVQLRVYNFKLAFSVYGCTFWRSLVAWVVSAVSLCVRRHHIKKRLGDKSGDDDRRLLVFSIWIISVNKI